ncbi:hypothetical protein EDB19DRAFT_662680 [Suillus lakei]|nr:hypothetical protein EDB19DRAFT_662680 [Suillus lakei]
MINPRSSQMRRLIPSMTLLSSTPQLRCLQGSYQVRPTKRSFTSLPLVLAPLLFTMLSGNILRLGPKVTLKLNTSPKPSNSDSSDQHSSSYQSSASAWPPVEASRSQKKRSRDSRYETDTPVIPAPAIPRATVPLRRKITTAMNGTSNVGYSQNNVKHSGYGGGSYPSEHLDQDCEMSAPTQLQDDWEMAS